jgi:radical SAM superfamily enzyme YgiQ (UPF0313 family)
VPATAPSLRALFFLDYADGRGGRFSNSPGLLPLVGHARRAGFDVPYVDDEELLLRLTDDPAVDVVAISSMERLLARSVAVATRVRQRRPDVVLMLGGNSIDPFAPDLAAGPFDVVVTGEGEHKFVPLLAAIARARGRRVSSAGRRPGLVISARRRDVGPAAPGGALPPAAVAAILEAGFARAIPGRRRALAAIGLGGVYVRDSAAGRVFLMEDPSPGDLEAAWRLDGRAAPVPPLSLSSTPLGSELDGLCVYPWEEWERHHWSTLEFYTQRGCRWGRCEFCSVADRDIRALSHDTILAVLREASSRGVDLVSFSDDLFVQDAEWNRRLLDRIITSDLGLKFRAQTMANRSLWPLLPALREAGFVELAFGVETLVPERARFMVKSFNGARYVAGALETVARTAEAGICPVLYMIMADPRSTLVEIARELADIVEALADIYRRTEVVPKLSYTLTMLPVAGPAMTSRFSYAVETVQLTDRVLRLPFEFHYPAPVARYLQRIADGTHAMPYRRENLAALPIYLDAVGEIARDIGDPKVAEILSAVERGLGRYREFEAQLDRDIEHTAHEFLSAAGAGPAGTSSGSALRFEFTRFGGYITGVQRYLELLDVAGAA